MNLQDFFKATRPDWQHSIKWDEQDRNLNKIEARREKLEDLAIESGKFEDLDAAEISDEALEYITK